MVAEVKENMMSYREFLQARQKIAALLSEVQDPEIPVISIVDLGMIIDIKHEKGKWHIDLAPTYSGCPAIDVIPLLVDMHLKENGINDAVSGMVLSPPWSTDWISASGKEKLYHYGIAPPGKRDQVMTEGRPGQCPQCGSAHVRLISRYGSTPCKAAYQCEDCLEPFDYFKCY